MIQLAPALRVNFPRNLTKLDVIKFFFFNLSKLDVILLNKLNKRKRELYW